MDIRLATIEEFKTLWDYSGSQTYLYFIKEIERHNVEFWTIDKNGDLIGELYIFWDSEDKQEANGINRAYLCAFRIREDYQGLGFGSKLMNQVLERIEEKGYTEVTIGVDNDNFDKLNNMYTKYGFKIHVKDKFVDEHYLDANGHPVVEEEPYKIIMKQIKKD